VAPPPLTSKVDLARGGETSEVDLVANYRSTVAATTSHAGFAGRSLVSRWPEWLSSTLAADAAEGRGALGPTTRALWPGARATGPALVVSLSRDDNAAMRDVPGRQPPPGTVLVIAGAAESRTAVMGDLVARSLLAAGIVAVVTDGLVRDSRAITELGLPVWCRGVVPVASAKNGPGAVGGSVVIDGVAVADGDVVVADDDGVVIWPSAESSGLLAAAERKRDADDERFRQLTGRG